MKKYIELSLEKSSVSYGLNMTWAFSRTSTRIKNMGYQNQIDLYNSISNTYREVMNEMKFDFLVPAGTAIQNARTNTYLKSVGDDLTRDGSHLDKGIGRYITALVMFEVIVNKDDKKDIFFDAKFNPLENSKQNNIIFLSKMAAKKAVANPFEVTNI